MYDLETGQTTKMDTGQETDQYIPRIRWTQNPETLAILRLNRLQNKMEILLAEVNSGESRVLYTEENKYYIEDGNFDDIEFLENATQFIIMSEKDGYKHVYLYDMDGKQISRITQGEWEVTGLLGIDQKNERIYYQSAEVSPRTGIFIP